MRNAFVVVLVSSFVVALVACGGAAPPATPAAAPERPGMVDIASEPASVEEAEQQIKDARAALEGTKQAEQDSATSSTQSTHTKTTDPTAGDSGAPGRCASSCRAIASMRRAVTALCRMAGETDARCTDAKKTLESSESRIATCGC